jgi:hypothetical protein
MTFFSIQIEVLREPAGSFVENVERAIHVHDEQATGSAGLLNDHVGSCEIGGFARAVDRAG